MGETVVSMRRAYATRIGASHRRMSNATNVRTLSTTCYVRTYERICISPTASMSTSVSRTRVRDFIGGLG